MSANPRSSPSYQRVAPTTNGRKNTRSKFGLAGLAGVAGILCVGIAIRNLVRHNQLKNYAQTKCLVNEYHLQKRLCGAVSPQPCYDEQFQVTYNVSTGEQVNSEISWAQRHSPSNDKKIGRVQPCWYDPVKTKTVTWELHPPGPGYYMFGVGVLCLLGALASAAWAMR